METVRAAWLLVIDIATGLALFAALTVAAVGAHHLAVWGVANGLDAPIVFGLRSAETLLAGADIVCLVFLVCYGVINSSTG